MSPAPVLSESIRNAANKMQMLWLLVNFPQEGKRLREKRWMTEIIYLFPPERSFKRDQTFKQPELKFLLFFQWKFIAPREGNSKKIRSDPLAHFRNSFQARYSVNDVGIHSYTLLVFLAAIHRQFGDGFQRSGAECR